MGLHFVEAFLADGLLEPFFWANIQHFFITTFNKFGAFPSHQAGTLDSFKETWESPDVSHLISTPGGPVDSEAGTSTPQRAGTMEVPELQRMSSLAPPQDFGGDLGRFFGRFFKGDLW